MTHHAKEQIIEAVSRITKEDLAMISEEQRKIMYNGLATKGRLAADPEECAKIDKQLETDPKNYYLWCARAIVCGDIEQAIENYSQALSIRQDDSICYAWLDNFEETAYNRAIENRWTASGFRIAG